VFLDADDRLLPEALKTGLKCFEAHPECAYVYGHFRVIARDGSFLKNRKQLIVGKDRYGGLLWCNYIAMHATVMYRRAVFESVGGFDTSLGACEDYDIYLRITRRFPVCGHKRVVAEYRRHGASMGNNPTLMLSASLSVLRSQRKHVKGHRQYKETYRDGIRFWQGLYGDQLVDEVRAHGREREWKRAIRGVLVLLRYYPRGLTLLLSERRMERHMERTRLVRELLALKQELEAHEQWLKELERAQELESTLVKKPKEVKQLRRRIHRLERQIQNLDQHALIGWNGNAWRLLRRLSRVKPRVRRLRELVRRDKP